MSADGNAFMAAALIREGAAETHAGADAAAAASTEAGGAVSEAVTFAAKAAEQSCTGAEVAMLATGLQAGVGA